MKITIELDTNSSEDIAILEDILGKSRKKGKKHSDLTAEQKAAIVARLEAGKRRKQAEREAQSSQLIEEDSLKQDPERPGLDDVSDQGIEQASKATGKAKKGRGGKHGTS